MCFFLQFLSCAIEAAVFQRWEYFYPKRGVVIFWSVVLLWLKCRALQAFLYGHSLMENSLVPAKFTARYEFANEGRKV